MRLALAIAVAAMLVPVAGAASSGSARLSVTKTPFSVHAARFAERERVSLTVSANARYTRSVTATVRGTFVARFRAVTVGPCDGYVVTARGSRGSRAVLELQPDCPPRPSVDDLHPPDPTPKR